MEKESTDDVSGLTMNTQEGPVVFVTKLGSWKVLVVEPGTERLGELKGDKYPVLSSLMVSYIEVLDARACEIL